MGFQNITRWSADWRKLHRRIQAWQRLRFGRRGENAAARFLTKRGYFIWKRNWRNRSGEIDIVAYFDQTLRIIEVKTRRKEHQSDYPAIDAVSDEKIKTMRKVAKSFVYRHAKQMRRRRLTKISFEAITVLFGQKWLNSAEIIHFRSLEDSFDFRNLNEHAEIQSDWGI